MHFLTFIYHIDDLIRVVELHTLYNRSQIRGRIQRSSIRFEQHARRYFLGVCIFLHINDQCIITHISISAIFHLLYHIRNIWLCIRLALPQIKIHFQVCIITLQVCDRHI